MKLFITGTDTEVGKTYISAGLLRAFGSRNFSTLGIKPVSSGSIYQGVNADAQALQAAATIKLPLEVINPIAFELAISPNIAAQYVNQILSVGLLLQKIQVALAVSADVYIIEGVGGWKAPLNEQETMADFVKALQLKTILVVGVRLGCINHAILTYEAIKRDGVDMVGWIANCLMPSMPALKENLVTLQTWLPVPCLGTVYYGMKPEESIDLAKISWPLDI